LVGRFRHREWEESSTILTGSNAVRIKEMVRNEKKLVSSRGERSLAESWWVGVAQTPFGTVSEGEKQPKARKRVRKT